MKSQTENQIYCTDVKLKKDETYTLDFYMTLINAKGITTP